MIVIKCVVSPLLCLYMFKNVFILFVKPKLNVEEMGSDFRQSSKVRIMVIIDLVRFVNLCIGSLYKFSNWYWGEHNHYFYSYMCLCLIKFVFCPLLSFIPLQNSSFQFLKMVVIFDDETCSQPIADGYLCLKWVSTPCKASLNVEEFIKCFHFLFSK